MLRHRDRSLKTLTLLLMGAAHGLHVGVNGPMMRDLGQQTGSTLPQISLTITASHVGWVIGSLTCGLCFSHLNFQVVAATLWTVVAVMHVLIPLSSHLWHVLLIYSVTGFAFGLFHTGQDAFVSTLWGRETLLFRIAITLVEGGSAAVSPMIVKPFLLPLVHHNDTLVLVPSLDDKHLLFPLSAIAFLMAASSLFGFVIWILFPVTTAHPSRNSGVSSKRELLVLSSKWKPCLIFLSCVVIFMVKNTNVAMGNYIPVFASSSALQLSAGTGAQLTTCYMAAMAITRLAGMVYVPIIGFMTNFILSNVVLAIACIVLLTAGQMHESALWIGVVLIAVAPANHMSCLFSYLEQMFPITGPISACAGMTGMVGGIVTPILISQFVEKEPQSLIWFLCFLSALSAFAVFAIMFTVARKCHTCKPDAN